MKSQVSVDALFARLAADVSRAFADASVTLRLLPSAISVDAALLKRVLENLVDDALHHAPAGTEVVLSARLCGGETMLSVRDHGPGIPEQLRATFFDMYSQGAVPRSGSRGIGLAFCRQAILSHGGRIWAENNADDGSTFCVASDRGPRRAEDASDHSLCRRGGPTIPLPAPRCTVASPPTPDGCGSRSTTRRSSRSRSTSGPVNAPDRDRARAAWDRAAPAAAQDRAAAKVTRAGVEHPSWA